MSAARRRVEDHRAAKAAVMREVRDGLIAQARRTARASAVPATASHGVVAASARDCRRCAQAGFR
ncbi:hypothetical protein [Saccharothrix texasensis]|uniref:Uncharacterized protein n=1 Tax=Saccharothrix texasensis TaxID=103734 RepID=A0A3N1H0F9_9PSEU|nr:hypothetical protein [Saccharothrix texasensis]ROP36035.1 hypothetical protein EDD40_1296 [Saccharothrix texasensis]